MIGETAVQAGDEQSPLLARRAPNRELLAPHAFGADGEGEADQAEDGHAQPAIGGIAFFDLDSRERVCRGEHELQQNVSDDGRGDADGHGPDENSLAEWRHVLTPLVAAIHYPA